MTYYNRLLHNSIKFLVIEYAKVQVFFNQTKWNNQGSNLEFLAKSQVVVSIANPQQF